MNASAITGQYSDVWQHIADRDPDRLAIVTPSGQLTYGDLAARAAALAAQLRRSGLVPGDSLAIVSYNHPDYLIALFAALATGIAPVPINFRLRPREVGALLKDADARAVVVPVSLASIVIEGAVDADRPVEYLWIDDVDDPGVAGVHLSSLESGDPLPHHAPDDTELRLYTGGTTGRPRAVVWLAADILRVQLYAAYGAAGIALPGTFADVLRIAVDADTPRVVSMPMAPLMHGTALFNTMNTLLLGGTVVLWDSPRFDPVGALDMVRRHQVTRLVLAGDAVAVPLVDAAEVTGGLGPVTSIISSGMRLRDDVKRSLHALGDLVIFDMLASTEGGPYAVAETRSAGDVPARLRLLPGAVVLDEHDRDVRHEVGAVGVLGFCGPLPQGYFRDPERTAQTFRLIGGVRHVTPGDWARVVGDGVIELLGRGSAVINTGGEKVYPAEVEEALLEHPDIDDVVVFGVPHDRFGEVIAAVVVLGSGAQLEPEGLREHLDRRLAGYKKPRHIVVRDTLNRSPHGKVDLARLRDEVKAILPTDFDPTGTIRLG